MIKKVFIIFVFAVLSTYLGLLTLAYFSRSSYDLLISKPVAFIDFSKRRMAKTPIYLSASFCSKADNDGGVSIYDKRKTYGDYTFFSSALGQKAYLIDMNGKVIHTWHLPFSDIWPNPGHIPTPVPEYRDIWNRAYLMPNGDVFVQFVGDGDVPWAYGLAKIDKDSHLIWKFSDFIHHDLAIDKNGVVYTFLERIVTTPNPLLPHVSPPYIDEFVILLSPQGQEIKRISLISAFNRGPAKNFLNILRNNISAGVFTGADLFHPNGLELISKKVARKAPFLKEGHILLSFRNTSLLAVLDPEHERITWASFGPWQHQHEPRFMPDGSVIVFDNDGNLNNYRTSRVLRVDLNSGKILWSYDGTPESPLSHENFNSSVEPLPNGNILITETCSGMIREVTQDKTMVWQYTFPERVTEGIQRIPNLYRARRYAKKDLPFMEPEPKPNIPDCHKPISHGRKRVHGSKSNCAS